jgi:hypothetical protein
MDSDEVSVTRQNEPVTGKPPLDAALAAVERALGAAGKDRVAIHPASLPKAVAILESIHRSLTAVRVHGIALPPALRIGVCPDRTAETGIPEPVSHPPACAWFHEPVLSVYSAGWPSLDSTPEWISTASEDHLLLHELGHACHWHASPELYETSGPAPPSARDVSGYAMEDAHEFVAEVFAGLVSGRTYPSDVLRAYEHLGGPLPGRHAARDRMSR